MFVGPVGFPEVLVGQRCEESRHGDTTSFASWGSGLVHLAHNRLVIGALDLGGRLLLIDVAVGEVADQAGDQEKAAVFGAE